MDADLIGDLLHFQRFDVLRTVIEEPFLVVDDRLSHLGQRAAALFDGVDQPLRRVDFPFDEVPFSVRRLAAHQPSTVVVADE